MNEICVGKIINDFDNGSQYLVLWTAPNNTHGYWYDLTSRSRRPIYFKVADVITDYTVGRYEITDFVPTGQMRTEESLSDTERQRRDKLWLIMKPAVESEPDIYDKKQRLSILRKIGTLNNLDPTNLYSLLDKYWRSGKTKNAFIPNYNRSGAKGKERTSFKAEKIGKTLTDIDRDNFAAAIKRHYLTRNKRTLKSTYEKLLQEYYVDKSASPSEKITLLPPNERPTFRQFQYWFSKNRDEVTEQKKRIGESAFELSGRSVLGKSDYGLMGPGAQFQIDSTVGDIYLVSQFDRSNLIGRPVIYFIIDTFSRMVVGMSVALEGPSWISMSGAIANMASDKVAFCKEHGIKISESEWPCRHIPSSLIGDRGELISKNSDNLVNMFGVRVVNTPPYRADLKGIVEQYFRTINTNSVALLPGGVKPDMAKRGGRDYRLDAKLDIRQLTQIIIKCVLHYNNHHYMEYFEKTEPMMRDQVEAIPIKLWEWGIRNLSGSLRSFPEDAVRLAVMPTDKATVTGKGIRFKGLFYSSDRAVNEAWFEKARSNKTWPVTVSYDPRNMTNIFIWNNYDKVYDKCSLLDWNSKNAGKHLDEIIYEQRKEKIVSRQLKSAAIESKVNLNAEIDAIVAEAQDMGKALPQKSKREKVSKIRENRREELEIIQSATSASDKSNKTVRSKATNAPISEYEMSPTLRMIKQKMEERQKND